MKSLLILVSSFLLSFGIFYGLGEFGQQARFSEVSGSQALTGIANSVAQKAPVFDRFRIPFSLSELDPVNYEEVKHELVSLRDSFRQAYQVAEAVGARQKIARQSEITFARFLTHRLIPFWYGTSWDFNGITQVPGKGKIACGYFVTTLLRDAGIPLNRIKLAQVASLEMISEVCKTDPVWLSGRTTRELVNWIKSDQGAIYVVGLDNHTGFLIREMESVWFIHASYRDPAVVLKERAESSEVLAESRIFVMGKLVPNQRVTMAWLGETR